MARPDNEQELAIVDDEIGAETPHWSQAGRTQQMDGGHGLSGCTHQA